MFSIIVDLSTVENKEKRVIKVEGDDRESLLVAWLNELLFLVDAQGLVFGSFHIEKWDERSHLEASAYGEPIDLKKHQLESEIKACTYHRLEIAHNSLYVCQVVFDV